MSRLGLSIAAAFFAFLLPMDANGHQEVKLHVEGSEIVGLPERYTPSIIKWDENSLTIKGRPLKLPSLFSSFFNAKRRNNKDQNLILDAGVAWILAISASWSQQEGNKGDLPDYMLFQLKPANKDYRIEMIVDLEDVAVVGLRVVLSTFSKENGDVWVNDQSPLLESVTSTELELVIDDAAVTVWDNRKSIEGVREK